VAVTRTPVCQRSIQNFALFVIAPMSIGESGKPYLLFRHFLQAHCCPLTSFLFQMTHLKSLSESACQNPALSATTSSRLGEVNPLPLLITLSRCRAFLFAGHGARVNVMLHARAAYGGHRVLIKIDQFSTSRSLPCLHVSLGTVERLSTELVIITRTIRYLT
jgi:hypothetical protein